MAEDLSACYNAVAIMTYYRLTAAIWKEGKRFVSKCPELGVVSYGPTPEKAQVALEEAVELYLSNAKKLGIMEDVPSIRKI